MLDAYEAEGCEFIQKVVANSDVLEEVSGLRQMKEEMAKKMDDLAVDSFDIDEDF